MTEMERELLALLDLIEVEEDSTLASQRLDIVISHGYELVFGEEISSRIQ